MIIIILNSNLNDNDAQDQHIYCHFCTLQGLEMFQQLIDIKHIPFTNKMYVLIYI